MCNNVIERDLFSLMAWTVPTNSDTDSFKYEIYRELFNNGPHRKYYVFYVSLDESNVPCGSEHSIGSFVTDSVDIKEVLSLAVDQIVTFFSNDLSKLRPIGFSFV